MYEYDRDTSEIKNDLLMESVSSGTAYPVYCKSIIETCKPELVSALLASYGEFCKASREHQAELDELNSELAEQLNKAYKDHITLNDNKICGTKFITPLVNRFNITIKDN